MIKKLLYRLAFGGVVSLFFWTTVYSIFDYFVDAESVDISDGPATFAWAVTAAVLAFFGFKVGKWVLALIPLTVLAASVAIPVEKLTEVIAQPDLNGDALFTIRDLMLAIPLIVFETGQRYSDLLFGPITETSKLVVFFEIDYRIVNWICKVMLTLFTWFMGVGWLKMLLETPSSWEPWELDEESSP